MKKYKVTTPLTFRDEVFVPIPDFIINSTINRYSVSNNGRVVDEWEHKDVPVYYTDPNYRRLFVDLTVFDGYNFIVQAFPLDMIVCMAFNRMNPCSSRTVGYRFNNPLDCTASNLYWKEEPITGTNTGRSKSSKTPNREKSIKMSDIFNNKALVQRVYNTMLDNPRTPHRQIADMCDIKYNTYDELRDITKVISDIRNRKRFTEWTKNFIAIPKYIR